MDDKPRPRRRAIGRSLALVALLVILIAGLVLFAWSRNPPDAPNPAGTAIPETLPPQR